MKLVHLLRMQPIPILKNGCKHHLGIQSRGTGHLQIIKCCTFEKQVNRTPQHLLSFSNTVLYQRYLHADFATIFENSRKHTQTPLLAGVGRIREEKKRNQILFDPPTESVIRILFRFPGSVISEIRKLRTAKRFANPQHELAPTLLTWKRY